LISSLKTYIPEGGSYFSALAYHLHHVANKWVWIVLDFWFCPFGFSIFDFGC
jgi:hypothetical protein